MPTTEVELEGEQIGIIDLMMACGLAASRGEARRLIQQGGVSVNGEKVPNQDFTVNADDLKAGVKIRKGKKIFHKAVLK